jgi:predicted nucleotidyltransferase
VKYKGFEYWIDNSGIQNSLFIAISGSYAYGWSRQDSDLDIRRVYFPALQQMVSPFFQPRPKEYQEKSSRIDVTEYPINHYLRLLASGNGNSLDNLFEEKLYENSKLVKELQNIVLENIHSGYLDHCLGYYQSLVKDMSNETRLKRYGMDKLLLQSYKILMEGIILGLHKEVIYNIPKQLEYIETLFCKELLDNYINYKDSSSKLQNDCLNELNHLQIILINLKDDLIPYHKSSIQISLDRYIRRYYTGDIGDKI